MNSIDIINARLYSQQITEPKITTVQSLVGWMGAMQAQDFAMVKWAVGLRLPGSTDKEVEVAIGRGEVIRTHLLRPTWHLVASEDIYWMLELTAPQIKAKIKTRHLDLGLDECVVSMSSSILAKKLVGGKQLLREELVTELEKAGIDTGDNRASHLFLRAELDGLVCSGEVKGGKQTYALLEEQIPRPKSLLRDEALVKLAQIYFSSHGPATLQDFAWWSGLSQSAARQALEMVKANLVSETIDAHTYWLSGSGSLSSNNKSLACLVPAYDELIISYSERRALLPPGFQKKAISMNGVFKPTLLVDGHVKGIWKRSIKNDKVLVAFEYFEPPDKETQELVEAAALLYAQFLEKKLIL